MASSKKNAYPSLTLPKMNNEQFDSDLYGNKDAIIGIDHKLINTQTPPSVSEIENIRDQAEQEGTAQGKEQGYQDGHKQGHQQGFEQGFIEGESKGVEQGKQAYLAKVAELEQIIHQFEKPLNILDDEIEQQLLYLVMTMATSVVDYEISSHPEHILNAIQQGIKALPIQNQQLTIQLNPEDVTVFNTLCTDKTEAQHYSLVNNVNLSRGDYIIQTVHSEVNYQLKARLEAVLFQTLAKHADLTQSIATFKTDNNTTESEPKVQQVTNKDTSITASESEIEETKQHGSSTTKPIQ